MTRLNALGTLNWGKQACGVFVFCATTAIALPAQILTTLFSFDQLDGGNPQAALIQGTDGNLYGTTVNGGANGAGTIFKITPGGSLTTLYSFCSESGCTDGDAPNALSIPAAIFTDPPPRNTARRSSTKTPSRNASRKPTSNSSLTRTPSASQSPPRLRP